MAQYQRSKANVDLAKLQQELQAAGLPVSHVLGGAIGSPDFTVVTAVDLTTEQIATMDAVIAVHDGRARRPRPIAAIYQQLVALTTAQQDAIIADLQIADAGSIVGKKWTLMKPHQDSAAAALRWSAVSLAGAAAGEKRQAAGYIVAMWCQQNPKYLVLPTFHPSLSGVNIPGDEPDV